VWIEKTKEDHEHGGEGWEYGTCLWSPNTSKIGTKIYELMKQPKVEDRVLHFYRVKGKFYFHGTSVVLQECKTTKERPPFPGDWDWANEFYRIELTSFKKNKNLIGITELAKKHALEIKEEIDNFSPKYYPFNNDPRGVRLAEGNYLSSCTETLYNLLRNYSELEKVKDIEKFNVPPGKTERKGLVTCRVSQGWYRRKLIEKWNNRCAVTGFDNEKILIASHIVPWSESSDKERNDVENGILLSPDLDGLFDRHLISFNNKGEIVISQNLKDTDLDLLGISRNMKLSKVTEGMIKYLDIHRQTFKKKNN